MDFVWNDGGRAACGFVGLAGDCVTRAIAIATGEVYRNVYQALGTAATKSPRDGVDVETSSSYLSQQGWTRHDGLKFKFVPQVLSKGVVIVSLEDRNGKARHLCTMVDHVIHDTWDPSEDDYHIRCYWTKEIALDQPGVIPSPQQRTSSPATELTQNEFEKILKRLRALDNTSKNEASTEGEKHNALRMMQSLMLRHNLTRDDIVDDDNVEHVQYTRVACPVNGRRAYNWEVSLAAYVTREIFPTVQWYRSSEGWRTLFWFYGSTSDVHNAIALFRELLLTIAAAAHLRYGSYCRGSGASYAEGYVAGLPRQQASTAPTEDQCMSTGTLIENRLSALKEAADDWLEIECDVRLRTSRRYGRNQHDPNAAMRGQRDGATHQIDRPNLPKRITSS